MFVFFVCLPHWVLVAPIGLGWFWWDWGCLSWLGWVRVSGWVVWDGLAWFNGLVWFRVA